ncbi:hypothetical protein NL676_025403 [Syzygium grande]|nr:hypothetical protein NL676_025403 [Syzygium grande]
MRAAVLWFLPMALATFTEKDHCDRTCGNISVPLPFGLDESCARNSSFVLTCNRTSAPPKLFLGSNIPVFNISVENGTMTVGSYISYDCRDQSGHRLKGSHPATSIKIREDWPYTVSDTRNKLTVFGCDTSALISDIERTFGSGCFSYCREDINFKAESACSGLGCCQTSIPKSLRSLNIKMGSSTKYTSVRNFSSCGSAFVVDQESFNVSDYKLPVPADIRLHTLSKIVLDWVVQRNLTCEQARLNQSSYACGANSRCCYFSNGQGYRCSCEAGYTGNPYGSRGCEDIDECKDPRQYPCHGNCKNMPGNYTCNCPFGTNGDGKIGCQTSHLVMIVAVIALPIFSITSVALVLGTFGAVLLELLTRKKPTSFVTKSGESINIIHYFISSVKDKTLYDVIDFEDASEDEMERARMVAEIAVKCLDQRGARRPAMREVAEQLARINRELNSSTVEENNEETESEVDEETESEVDEENLSSLATSITSEMSQHGTSGPLFYPAGYSI